MPKPSRGTLAPQVTVATGVKSRAGALPEWFPVSLVPQCRSGSFLANVTLACVETVHPQPHSGSGPSVLANAMVSSGQSLV